MQLSLEIDYRNVQPSSPIDDLLRKRAAKLEHLCPRLSGCSVTLEAPHHHHRHGNAYQVHLRLTVPGSVVAVSRDHSDKDHEDLYVAIRDAFDAAERQLEDWVQIQRQGAKLVVGAAPEEG